MNTDTIYIPPSTPHLKDTHVHRIVRYNYPTRIIGFLYLLLLTIVYYWPNFLGTRMAVPFATGCLMWPHLAFLFARYSSESKRAELINMYADAMVVGLWVGFMQFSLWPTVAAVAGVNISHIAYRGIPLMLKGLIPTAAGMLFSGWVNDFVFRPDANLAASLVSIAVVFFFTGLIAWRSFQQSRYLILGQRQLEEKNRQISQLATGLEQRVAERTAELRRKLFEMEMIYKVTSGLASDLTLEQRLQMIIDTAVEVIRSAEKGSILLYNEETGFLEIKAACGYDMQTVREFRLRPGEGFGGVAFAKRESLVLPRIAPELIAAGNLSQMQRIQSAMVAVLAIRDRVIGVISLDNLSKEDAFTQADMSLLSSFAAHAAVALENARLFTELEEYKSYLERKVDERTLELRNAQAQLVQSEKMASLGQLTAGVAHEINNPITFLYSNLPHLESYVHFFKDILQRIETHLSQEERQYLQSMKSNTDFDYIWEDVEKLLQSYRNGAERIKEIVSILRNFSRMDEQDLKFVNLNEGIESTLVLIRKQFGDRVRIETRLGELPEVECFPGQLNQVFMNVIINAMQAIQDRGTVEIETRLVRDHVEIAIQDNGMGMDEVTQTRMFEPFFTTKPVGTGTGLGLSISYGILERHHGRIHVTSQPGRGTRVVIDLPIRQPPEARPQSRD